ncbi:hypothetical protein PoB_001736900 [Plakobranchus ocellatus]|uniref:Uncharacterized protein n=1 Tax=Plakobranchus ocellatus TaxID=259542 RepID=A0AAV3ZA95_9GAST|nr:hypothetical protein PoB_001736900 [Plakobranchus ocellatus]
MELSRDDNLHYACDIEGGHETLVSVTESLGDDIQTEAGAAAAVLLELSPALQGLQNKLNRTRFAMSKSKASQCLQMKKLLCQLEALQAQMTEMQSDENEMKRDIQTILSDKVVATDLSISSSDGAPLALEDSVMLPLRLQEFAKGSSVMLINKEEEDQCNTSPNTQTASKEVLELHELRVENDGKTKQYEQADWSTQHMEAKTKKARERCFARKSLNHHIQSDQDLISFLKQEVEANLETEVDGEFFSKWSAEFLQHLRRPKNSDETEAAQPGVETSRSKPGFQARERMRTWRRRKVTHQAQGNLKPSASQQQIKKRLCKQELRKKIDRERKQHERAKWSVQKREAERKKARERYNTKKQNCNHQELTSALNKAMSADVEYSDDNNKFSTEGSAELLEHLRELHNSCDLQNAQSGVKASKPRAQRSKEYGAQLREEQPEGCNSILDKQRIRGKKRRETFKFKTTKDTQKEQEKVRKCCEWKSIHKAQDNLLPPASLTKQRLNKQEQRRKTYRERKQEERAKWSLQMRHLEREKARHRYLARKKNNKVHDMDWNQESTSNLNKAKKGKAEIDPIAYHESLKKKPFVSLDKQRKQACLEQLDLKVRTPGAQRAKEYRERLRKERPEAYKDMLKKQRMRNKKRREIFKIKASEEDREREREKSRGRAKKRYQMKAKHQAPDKLNLSVSQQNAKQEMNRESEQQKGVKELSQSTYAERDQASDDSHYAKEEIHNQDVRCCQDITSFLNQAMEANLKLDDDCELFSNKSVTCLKQLSEQQCSEEPQAAQTAIKGNKPGSQQRSEDLYKRHRKGRLKKHRALQEKQRIRNKQRWQFFKQTATKEEKERERTKVKERVRKWRELKNAHKAQNKLSSPASQQKKKQRSRQPLSQQDIKRKMENVELRRKVDRERKQRERAKWSLQKKAAENKKARDRYHAKRKSYVQRAQNDHDYVLPLNRVMRTDRVNQARLKKDRYPRKKAHIQCVRRDHDYVLPLNKIVKVKLEATEEFEQSQIKRGMANQT